MPTDSPLTRRKLQAAFVRGGTSKGLLFHARELPERAAWDEIFLAAMGSPDTYGRQLDGMGGGVSSLSKVCVVGAATRPDADIDFTFGQVMIAEPRVDYSGNCGNMSAAIGPFSVDEGLVRAADGETVVRIHNTNTGKIIHATFQVKDRRAITEGDLAIPGVSGTGAQIRLDFLDPGGAGTGRLLPTGRSIDELEIPGLGAVKVSIVDAANACVFVSAHDVGLTGYESPAVLEREVIALGKLDLIRVHAAVAMGLAKSPDDARTRPAIPYIGIVAAPGSGGGFSARVVASGQPHRALPLTVSLCLAVASRIDGTVVNGVARQPEGDLIHIEMPSGNLAVGAEVVMRRGVWHATRGSFYRTQRRLFDGTLYC